MQTYTHLAVGTAIGGLLAHIAPTEQTLVVTATVIGAGMPDVPIAFQMLADMFYHKRAPFSEAHNQPGWMLAKEVSHSHPVFFTLTVLFGFVSVTTYTNLGVPLIMMVTGFLYGVNSHILIDELTHCGKEYKETDQSCFWPLYPHVIKNKASELIGIAEYRLSAGALWPLKPFELVTLVASAIVAIVTILF